MASWLLPLALAAAMAFAVALSGVAGPPERVAKFLAVLLGVGLPPLLLLRLLERRRGRRE